MNAPAFIPLLFRPGEAYQFDWSHEDVEIAGKPMRVKVAHVRLCASRVIYVRAYPRETQEMLDFCGAHNIVSDIEMIKMQDIEAAYELFSHQRDGVLKVALRP